MDENNEIVKFKAQYWYARDIERDNKLYIYVGGRTIDNKTVFIRIDRFTPFIYLELPSRIKWTKSRLRCLFEYFQQTFKPYAPINYQFYNKKRLHYKKEIKAMGLTFRSKKGIQLLSNRFRYNKNVVIDGVGVLHPRDVIVHESNIDSVIKLTANNNIKLAYWIQAKPINDDFELDDDEKVDEEFEPIADIGFNAHYMDVIPCEPPRTDIVVMPTYISFDIECYSKNHNSKLPDSSHDENVVFQISVIYGVLTREIKAKYLLTLFNPHDIPGVEMLRHKIESDLLLGFVHLVNKLDPDIFITYNGMKFDWDYLIKRAEKLQIIRKFVQMSRMDIESEIKTSSWGSNAYGKQEFRYLEAHGRTNVDVLLEIERNYKLPKYSLNVVAKKFLGEQKDDITPRQLFMLYQVTSDILPHIEKKTPNNSEIRMYRKMIENIFPPRKTHGVVLELKNNLLNCTNKQFVGLIREALTITGRYCVQDTILPIKIAEKLNLWITMEEMSNVMNVPPSYLHTRGQQIKVVAQVFRETIKNDIIIPYMTEQEKKEEGGKFQGAIVIEAHPGFYTLIVVLDFASLYPSVMIAFNICYTTILEDSDPTPDSECHVLEFSDHRGCIHDKQKRKVKKEDVLCCDRRLRFRKVKVIIHEDGTIERKDVGLMPQIEMDLLSNRKKVKKEMFKAEARYKMQMGKASVEDIELYKKCGFEIIEAGSLGPNETMMLGVTVNVLNAKQLALKISANSAYGILGAATGTMPFIKGAASVTAMGRRLIIAAIEKIRKTWSYAKLVYGDTDSCMIQFTGCDIKETFRHGDMASDIASHYLKTQIIGVPEDYKVTLQNTGEKVPLKDVKMDEHFKHLSNEDKIWVIKYNDNPIDLEFENMYGDFFLLTKKRYMAYIYNKDGKIIDSVEKGIVLKRRDNCDVLRNIYKPAKDGIMAGKDEKFVYYTIMDGIHAMFTRQVPDEDYIIYVGIGDLKDYTKKNDKGETIDKDGNVFETEDFNDPRLIYTNAVQVALARKCTSRGDQIPPNTRLEFIFLETRKCVHDLNKETCEQCCNNKDCGGELAEDYTYYKENRDLYEMRPDTIHYLENKLANPLYELYSVRFPKGISVHEKFEPLVKQLFKVTDSTTRTGKKVFFEPNLIYYLDEYNLEPFPFDDSVKYQNARKCSYIKQRPSNQPQYRFKYETRGLDAQIEYLLENVNTGRRSLQTTKQPRIIELCKRWRAKRVLDKHYKAHKMTKPQVRRGQGAGGEFLDLVRNKNIVFLKDFKNAKEGTKGVIIQSDKETNTYKILIDEAKEIFVENVPRKYINTYYVINSKMMVDIVKYRKTYKKVVARLTELFDEGYRFKLEKYAEEYKDKREVVITMIN